MAKGQSTGFPLAIKHYDKIQQSEPYDFRYNLKKKTSKR
jgi:hypothetical protein